MDIKIFRLAVLPFANLSPRAENEFFSDGITEEIIGALSKIKNLRVTSRTSSFYFKNKNIPIKQIAKELGVEAILEGSVRLSGDVVRITAQLIQANDDFHFWSETWERKLEGIFEIQDEISLLIADKIREQFVYLEVQEHLVEKQTANISAYEYYLKALSHFRKWNSTDINIAISLFKKALELDAENAQSMIGLADCYSFMATNGFIAPEEGWRNAHQLTHQAVALNDRLPSAHYMLSNLALFTASDYAQSFKHVAMALELNPNYAEAQRHMAFLYILAGDQEKSREHLEVARQIDPLSKETHFYSAYYHYMTGDYPKAVLMLDQCLHHNPKNLPAHILKCLVLMKQSKLDEVITYFKNHTVEATVEDEIGVLAIAYALKNDLINAEKSMTNLIALTKGVNGFTANAYIFVLYGATGQVNKAFDWIEQNQAYSPLLMFHFADPLVSPIRIDPRYRELHQKFYPLHLLNEGESMKKDLLDADSISVYSMRLQNHIQQNKPYLDPNLSLRKLAAQIDIHPNQLSWLLNTTMKQSFNEFINHYRVVAFKERCADPKNNHLTLVGLAYECGFNSKTVFNTFFKRETGITPKEYQNSLRSRSTI